MVGKRETVNVADHDASSRKAALRQQILGARAARTAVERSEAGQRLADLVGERCNSPAVVAAYLSMPTEPSTRELIARLRATDVDVIVPVVEGERLDWVAYDEHAGAPPGKFGIPTPSGQSLGVDAVTRADVVFVPALAADRRGNRLGRGRGIYDRALREVTAPVVAVVYDEELLDDVPVERHDRPVSAVLTPSGWIDVVGSV
jgi:5-formyltetrahydrofolate cyclo-ligase